MDVAAGQQWDLRARDVVRARHFGSHALVFNPVTWDTHLLTGASLAVFVRLLQSPATVEELARALAPSGPDHAPGTALHEKARSVIEELRRLELVRPPTPER
jgi:PqqD family protein of HPr-rel-A system